MSTRHPPLSHPPCGDFDSQNSELRWQLCSNKGVSQLCCRIPGHRCDDFLRGEGKRANTQFWQLKKKRQAQVININFVFSEVVYSSFLLKIAKLANQSKVIMQCTNSDSKSSKGA